MHPPTLRCMTSLLCEPQRVSVDPSPSFGWKPLMLLAVAAALPIPIVTASGLSFPLPGVVERVATALVPGAPAPEPSANNEALRSYASIVIAPTRREASPTPPGTGARGAEWTAAPSPRPTSRPTSRPSKLYTTERQDHVLTPAAISTALSRTRTATADAATPGGAPRAVPVATGSTSAEPAMTVGGAPDGTGNGASANGSATETKARQETKLNATVTTVTPTADTTTTDPATTTPPTDPAPTDSGTTTTPPADSGTSGNNAGGNGKSTTSNAGGNSGSSNAGGNGNSTTSNAGGNGKSATSSTTGTP